MAHVLLGQDGLCAHLHGLSFVLQVTVAGPPAQMPGHPKDGILLDLNDLKEIVEAAVVRRLDHSTVINSATPETMAPIGQRVIRVPFQPTCENMLHHKVTDISALLPSEVILCSVRLDETANRWAEFRKEDQVLFRSMDSASQSVFEH